MKRMNTFVLLTLLIGAGLSSAQITAIEDIQDDPASFIGQIVTVEGQVYIPTDYRTPTIVGYIQDTSARGICLFGTGADVPELRDTANIVRVTGEVDVYFTTVEILDITEVVLLSTGNPPLSPTSLSTGAAADSDWEGTYIQVTGDIQYGAVVGPGMNYTVDDGSGPIVVRVVDTLGVEVFEIGATITAGGAGSRYGTDHQVLVGVPADVFEEGGPEVVPIADIQENYADYIGQTVTVEGQVYIPTDYRGYLTSGYIQDGSGRGINLYGTGADVPELKDTGNSVRLTGEVDIYFTTVEIVNVRSVELLDSGLPPLEPVFLSTGDAASPDWEGTYIEVSAPIVAQVVLGPGINYTVDDGSGPIDLRVVDALGVPAFANGTRVRAAGAGSRYGTLYQVTVGAAGDIGEDELAATGPIAVPRDELKLWPGTPNPFNPSTRIDYIVPEAGRVRLGVHDLGGRRVRVLLDGRTAAGFGSVDWDGCDDAGRRIASGVYLLRLETSDEVVVGKVLLAK